MTRSSRNHASGTKRIESSRPIRMAEVILDYDRGWSGDRVRSMVDARGSTTDITLEKRVPVHIAYFTAIAEDDGKIRYTRDLIAHRRATPQDDLLSALVHAEDEGNQLNEDELISMVLLLIIAGYETTLNLIANGTRALLAHPDQRALLRAEPERIEAAVEEILRYDSPAQSTKMLYPTEPITLQGVTIPRAATVMPLIGSANRDERVFSDPDRFDITRSPNKNLAFGHGIHYCLGAPLARLEGQIALNVLLARCPDLRLAVPPQEVRYQTRPLWHRLESLPVALA